MKGFGYKQDLPEQRYIAFEENKERFGLDKASSSTEHYLKDELPISNQENLQSCVADATTTALELLLAIEGEEVIQLARLLTYWNARMLTSDTDKDEGTYIRNAFQSLSSLGVCPESEWPYDTSKVFAQPPITAYQSANANKVISYYRIGETGKARADSVELAIRNDKPVVFGAGISEEFVNDYSGDEKVWDTPSSIVGRHAMVLTGVRVLSNGKREFLLRNSWGFDWGRNGRNWISEDYLISNQVSDIWVPTLMPKLLV